jgi:hypothetical protein
MGMMPSIQKAIWTQCENPNCGKWRKLPPSTTVDEDAPWYCYMNPDAEHSTCEAAEEVRRSLLAAGRRPPPPPRPPLKARHPRHPCRPMTRTLRS